MLKYNETHTNAHKRAQTHTHYSEKQQEVTPAASALNTFVQVRQAHLWVIYSSGAVGTGNRELEESVLANTL